MRYSVKKKSKPKALRKKRVVIVTFSLAALMFTASFTYVSLFQSSNQKVMADETAIPTFYCLGNKSCDKVSDTPAQTVTTQRKRKLHVAGQKQVIDLGKYIATPSSGMNTCQRKTTGYNKFFTYLMTLLCEYFHVACNQLSTPTANGTTCPTPTVTPLVSRTMISPTLTVTAPSITLTLSPTIPPSVTPIPTPTPTIETTGQTVSPTAQDGGNYSGYAYAITQPAVNDTVTLTWTAVHMICGKGLISPWVGMGDLPATEHNLAQLGIDYDCAGGSPLYEPWTEALPAGSVYYTNDTVKEGDTLVSSITYQGNGTFLTKLSDTQQGWSISLPMHYANTYVAQGGEAILEELGNQVQQFAPQDFTNFTFGNGSTTNLLPVSSAQKIIRYDMTHAVSSPLSGSSFTMTYK